MTCTLIGYLLSCLLTPAPPTREATAALLAPYAAIGYVSFQREDGLHVVFSIGPSAPLRTVVEPPLARCAAPLEWWR